MLPESSATSGPWHPFNMWLLKLRASLLPSIFSLHCCKTGRNMAFPSYNFQWYLTDYKNNNSKARVPPNPLRISPALSPDNVFTSCVQVKLNYCCSPNARVMYLIASFSFSEILTHHLRISLNVLTWVGSFTNPFPQQG